jgi:hypothetical protein
MGQPGLTDAVPETKLHNIVTPFRSDRSKRPARLPTVPKRGRNVIEAALVDGPAAVNDGVRIASPLG